LSDRSFTAGYCGKVGFLHSYLSGYLVAQKLHVFRRGTDEFYLAGFTYLCKMGVLGKKTVARVDSFYVGYLCGAYDGGYIEIAVRALGRTDTYGLIRELHMKGN